MKKLRLMYFQFWKWRRNRTIINIIAMMCVASAIMAETGPGQSSGVNRRQSKNSTGEVTVQGCLGTVSGDYLLMQFDPGNSYILEGGRKVKLGPHLGQQVEVTGWETASLSSSSDISNRVGSPSSVTIMVTSIRVIARECIAGTRARGRAGSEESEAQLNIMSTPAGADIEIDGHFVGSTPSEIGVAAGQHQLVLKKKGFIPWEKKIEISTGHVNVEAALQAESK